MTGPLGSRPTRGELPARERLFHAACIVAIPWLQLAINRNLFINPAGEWIDPWLYTAASSAFPPSPAVCSTYRHGCRSCCPASLHTACCPPGRQLRASFDIFYVLLFATYGSSAQGGGRARFWSRSSWDGTRRSWRRSVGTTWTGPIVFLVLTLFFLEKAAADRAAGGVERPARMACMASSNLFLSVMSPLVLLFFVVRMGFANWRSILSTAVFAAVGGAAMLLALAFANRIYGGAWLFMAPSFAVARDLAANPTQWRELSWHHRAMWLALPGIAILGASIDLTLPTRDASRFARAMQVILLATAAVWTGFELHGPPVLQLPYYASYLVPLSVLALPLQAGALVSATERSSNVTWILTTVGLFALAHWLFLTRTPGVAFTLSQWPSARYLYERLWFGPFSLQSFSMLMAVAAGVLALLSLRCLRAMPSRWFGLAIGLAIGCAAVPANWPLASSTNTQKSFEEVVAIDRYVTQQLGNRTPRFWYEATSIPKWSLKSISSAYFWGFSLVNEHLPVLTAEEARVLPANTRFVFLLPPDEAISPAKQALLKNGIDLAFVDRRVFGEGDRAVSVILADLVRIPTFDAR